MEVHYYNDNALTLLLKQIFISERFLKYDENNIVIEH